MCPCFGAVHSWKGKRTDVTPLLKPRATTTLTLDRIGRWLLAAAIILGWAIGYGTEIHQAAIALLFSFLAGGVVLNVLKEELPEERQSKFWAFAFGAAIYAALLVAV